MMIVQNITAQSAAVPSRGTEDRKLVDAAQQFEGMLLQELLKPMRSDDEQNYWSGDTDSDSGTDTINSFGVQAVATAISKNGGLGIARKVIQQVTAEHEKSRPVVHSG
jgi:Rod binding domain-containing protein